MPTHSMIIDGEKVCGESTFSVNNPSTGEPAGYAPNATVHDLDKAVMSAQSAFASWSQLPDEKLASYCSKVTEKIGEHAEELAQLLTAEQGKPLNGLGSRWEMGGAQAWAGFTTGLSLPVKVLQDNNEGKVELFRKPIGVVGSILPWNFPVMIAIWHIMPALRTGNTIVVKPSPMTPLATLRLVKIMNEVLPKGVVNIISSDDNVGDNVGAAMSSHEGIRKIVFTGSTKTGIKVAANAVETVKRMTLEMGGNDAAIVLPDVDAKSIAEGLFWGGFINNGQTCACMKRLYVHEDVYDDVCNALVEFAKNIPIGDGMEENSVLGPIQNQMQFDKVSRLVEEGKAKGRVLLGGDPGEGLFYPPTIIADLENGDPLVDEEQFGPALPIIKYSDVEDAIAAANDNPSGLGGSVWSNNIEEAKKIGGRLQCGSVWINKHGAIQPNAPFGGVKSSGVGVEFGEEGLAEYTDVQVIFT